MVHVDELDQALCRAHEIFLQDLSDETEIELEALLPPLVAAGYVEEDERLDAWSFTDKGVRRGEELGCL
jgi:hypothetical protein